MIELVFLAKVQVSACFCAKKTFFCDPKSTFNSFKIMENLSSYAAVPTNYASFGRRLVAIIIRQFNYIKNNNSLIYINQEILKLCKAA
ncbi:MAG: hypothetical protein EAZ26_08140, partial [Runella slithyformis]